MKISPRDGIAVVAALTSVTATFAADRQPPSDEVDATYTTVITPARLKQSLQDAPASVTVITAEQLRRLNIEHVWDALRLVPGMEVTESTANRVLVNYHGTNIRNPRRMNVLIDGMSVYRPGFSEIYWGQLPVVIEDIERIEVTRGPNSAAYGPNSMMAIVNIITKHPGDVPKASGSVMRAGGGEYRGHVRLATTLGDTALHVSASSEGSDGYDRIDGVRPGHDATRAKRLLVRSHTALSPGQSLGLEVAYVQGKSEIPYKSAYDVDYPDKDVRDGYVAGTWKASWSPRHELQVRVTHSTNSTDQRWTSCYPTMAFLPELNALWRANPSYVAALVAGKIPSGGTPADDMLALQAAAAIQRLGAQAMLPLCGLANQDIVEKRTDVEVQETYVASQQLRFVGGVGARRQSLDSQTFLGGKQSNDLYRIFGNVEYRPVESVNINLGAYAEHDELVGWSTAPRGAVNFHVTPNQTLRVVVSRGLRTPDLVEQRGNFSYTLQTALPGPTGTTSPVFFQTAQSAGGLRSEVADSREVGYMVNMPRLGLQFDVRVFDEKLTKLISETVDVASFRPTNNNGVTLRGAEIQANVAITPSWSSFATYTYLENRGATTSFERSQYSRHSGSVGLTYTGASGWRAALAYYGSSGDGLGESSFGRLDLALGKRLAVGSTVFDVSLFARRYDNTLVGYAINSGSVRSSERDEQVQLGAKVSVAF